MDGVRYGGRQNSSLSLRCNSPLGFSTYSPIWKLSKSCPTGVLQRPPCISSTKIWTTMQNSGRTRKARSDVNGLNGETARLACSDHAWLLCHAPFFWGQGRFSETRVFWANVRQDNSGNYFMLGPYTQRWVKISGLGKINSSFYDMTYFEEKKEQIKKKRG